MPYKIFLLFLFVFLVVKGFSQDQPKPDTLEIGGVVIIRENAPPPENNEKKGFLKKLNSKKNPRNISTEFLVLDIGFANYVDNTVYGSGTPANGYAPGSNESWMKINPIKSRNVNLWLVMQQLNIVNHYVNFQYGIGLELNNYRYKQPIRYTAQTAPNQNAAVIQLDNTAGRTYIKNKLATDYFTIPAMFNVNIAPNRVYAFELSAGVSVGYLYSARNKVINSDEGKIRSRGDFDLRPWKLSYIGELNLGVLRLYGSYAFKSMYKRGLDITPYNFGIRIKPVQLFGKIETN
ncbi:MAG TPA: outer membrane beta-barrel protein [Niabella sp.]|nr:outer membrane beta-barrel protein [Niabella sp.]HQW15263.1 outer membrane beta-barrel protein [Niabella sp.]HQX20487.1 outer membrane beta-barrel protein [Niabella sp.]HQX42570.1 outer membrane beta-barrel protein [Niabella sp.]HRB06882.1 outer membrane beta-barrel protein [Niabella sp.]